MSFFRVSSLIVGFSAKNNLAFSVIILAISWNMITLTLYWNFLSRKNRKHWKVFLCLSFTSTKPYISKLCPFDDAFIPELENSSIKVLSPFQSLKETVIYSCVQAMKWRKRAIICSKSRGMFSFMLALVKRCKIAFFLALSSSASRDGAWELSLKAWNCIFRACTCPSLFLSLLLMGLQYASNKYPWSLFIA